MAESAIPSCESERFLPVPGYGRYQVSNRGRVWSSYGKGRFLKPQPFGPMRYPGVTLYGNGVGQQIAVHRIVMLAFVGPCPEGLQVLHGDGDSSRPWLNNLSYGTPAMNGRDKARHGTAKAAALRGSAHHQAKLTEEIVHQARIEYAAGGVSMLRLATRYGVSAPTLYHALVRNTWKHVA